MQDNSTKVDLWFSSMTEAALDVPAVVTTTACFHLLCKRYVSSSSCSPITVNFGSLPESSTSALVYYQINSGGQAREHALNSSRPSNKTRHLVRVA